MPKNYFYKKVVVITGATGVLGSSTAKAFARTGAHIILIARDKNKLQALGKELASQYYALAVEKNNQVQLAVKNIIAKNKRIDILVNCAGILGPVGKLHTNPIEAWEKTLAVNLFGTVHMTQAVLPYMLKQKGGKIVNFSGGGATGPFENFSAYAASKAAVVRFTENIAAEYKDFNIHINAVAPGAINSKFLNDMFLAGEQKVGNGYFKKILEQKKSGGDSSELAAELVLYLCSPEAHGITGKLISAKWDPWKKFNQSAIGKINKTSEYTLRRIDNKYFKEI